MAELDLTQFSSKMLKYSEDLPTSISDSVRDATVDSSALLVSTTPIDTGLARGGWRISTTEDSSEESKVLDKEGAPTIAKMAAAAKSKQPGQPLVVYNNVPYVGKLDRGSSRQAPAGMTPAFFRAIKRAIASIKSGYPDD